MENSSPSATSQNSPTPFPSNAFNPLLTILTLLALPVIVFVIGAAATLYAVGHGETTFLNAPRWANGLPGVQIQGVVEAAIVAFLLLVLPEIAKVPLQRLGFYKLSVAQLRFALGGALVMVVVITGLASLLQWALHAKVSEQAVTLFLNLKSPGAKVEFALLGIVLAPIAEETVFRVFIFNAARKYGGFWVGAVASGLLFGAAHAQPGISPAQTVILALPLALGGVILCTVYAKTGNAYASMVTHGAFNAVTMAVLFFAPQLAK